MILSREEIQEQFKHRVLSDEEVAAIQKLLARVPPPMVCTVCGGEVVNNPTSLAEKRHRLCSPEE